MGEGRGLSMEPMLAGTLASFLGGICVFRLGRRLRHSRLEMIHWLHLTPTRLEWPQRFFRRHGDKTVFLARFIPVLPSAAATLLEGTTTISWPTYLWLNLAGSAAYTTVYILLGYFLGSFCKRGLAQRRFMPSWSQALSSLSGLCSAKRYSNISHACRPSEQNERRAWARILNEWRESDSPLAGPKILRAYYRGLKPACFPAPTLAAGLKTRL
jgi:hypothetical protein